MPGHYILHPETLDCTMSQSSMSNKGTKGKQWSNKPLEEKGKSCQITVKLDVHNLRTKTTTRKATAIFSINKNAAIISLRVCSNVDTLLYREMLCTRCPKNKCKGFFFHHKSKLCTAECSFFPQMWHYRSEPFAKVPKLINMFMKIYITF